MKPEPYVSSFPYLNVAKDHNVPYGAVLWLADVLDKQIKVEAILSGEFHRAAERLDGLSDHLREHDCFSQGWRWIFGKWVQATISAWAKQTATKLNDAD